MTAVDLEVVRSWLHHSRQAVSSQMLRGGTPEKIAFLQGSKAMLTMLDEQVSTERFGAAPISVPEKTPVKHDTDYMSALDGEKFAAYIERTKKESVERGLNDVVGFIQALEFHFKIGDFDPDAKPEVHVVTVYKDAPATATQRVRTRALTQRVEGEVWTEALAKIKPSSQHTFEAIMKAYEHGPLNDDDLRDRLQKMGRGMVPGTVTARRGDLSWAGWLQDSGLRSPGDSGSMMKVWELAP